MPVSISLRWKLFAIAALAQFSTFSLTMSAWVGFQQMRDASEDVRHIEIVRISFQDADMMHDALRGDVYRTLSGEMVGERHEEILAVSAVDAQRYRKELDSIAMESPPALRALFSEVRAPTERYISLAERIIEGGDSSQELLASFEALFRDIERLNDHTLETIERQVSALHSREETVRRHFLWQILLGGLFSMCALLLSTHLLCTSIIRQLADLALVARRVIAGEMDARTQSQGDDEIALVGKAFDEMADSLTKAVTHLESEAQRDGFRGHLVEALEMADEEEEALDVVRRAMEEVAPDAPMELLLSDSSRAHLQHAVSPRAGAPGCGVQSPFGCVAVRRGNPVVFPDSEALNACSKLRNRPGGSCSAVCVPVTFMGRALGVLHAAGPAGRPLRPEHVAQLTTLATQAGARIGTVRAFQKTQLQASTDGMTGLINRRTIEAEVRQLFQARTPFTMVMADLDHFKKLNDTYGHEAGDRALRTFSRILKSTLRSSDIPSRLGGEEFAIVMPQTSSDAAILAVERIRAALHDSTAAGHPRFTASFGIADSTQASSFNALLSMTDAALYRAKAMGRDRYECCTLSDAEQERLKTRTADPLQSTTSGMSSPRRQRPTLQQVADGEEEPRASGVEIR